MILNAYCNHSYTTAYAEAVSAFGRMIEVRVARNTQHLPIFVRMLDKERDKIILFLVGESVTFRH